MSIARLLSNSDTVHHMPIRFHIKLLCLGGGEIWISLRGRGATVSDLKDAVRLHLNVSRNSFKICSGVERLDNRTPLVNLLEWFCIADLVNNRFMMTVELEVCLVMVRRLCHSCGANASHLCGSCRRLAYCSPVCQLLDWPAHKHHCRRR